MHTRAFSAVVILSLAALLVLSTGCSGCQDGSGERKASAATAGSDNHAKTRSPSPPPQEHEPPERQEIEFTVTEESAKDIPGSEGRLRLVLRDINDDRVRMAVIQTNDESEVSSTSATAGDVLEFVFDGREWQIRVKRLFNFVVEDDYGVFVVEAPTSRPSDGSSGADSDTINVLALPEKLTVKAGKPFTEWMGNRGWESEFGSPEFFFVREGILHLVSKPGPVYRDRYSLAIFNRQKLIQGMENKVLLRLAGGRDFRVDTEEFPFLTFKMTPIKLPGKGADLRDPDKNDCAFYLLVGFDTKRHDFEGRKMPETVAYVWANRKWDSGVGKDSDYAEFLRYIPIGHGSKGLEKPHEVTRNLREDYRSAYPDKASKPVPDLIKAGIMIDSNTVDSTAESALHWIRFRANSPPSEAQD